MKVIRFRRLSRPPQVIKQTVYMGGYPGLLAPRTFVVERLVHLWEIAFDEEHLRAKLDGEMAEVIMPAKPWYVRLWRRWFPLRGIEMEATVL